MKKKKPKKYQQPDYCTCVFTENTDKLPCGKCGEVPELMYRIVCGFILKDGICLCPECHDKMDDCKNL